MTGCGEEWCTDPWTWMTYFIEGMLGRLKMLESWAGGGTEIDGGTWG